MNEQQEREANQFAMELMIPMEWLRRELRAYRKMDLLDDSVVKDLAKKFRVPVALMGMRLGELYREKGEV